MPAEVPYHIQLSINQWWTRWGFSDNPFARGVSEEQFFPHFFVDTGKFAWIYGDPLKPGTVLFFAGRGCGKTAHRLKLENDSGPLQPKSCVLSVVYNQFDDWRLAEGIPMPEFHVKLILRQGLDAIFKTIASQSGPQIRDLSTSFFALLKPLADRYIPEALNRLERGLDLSWLRTAVDRKAFAQFQTRLIKTDLISYPASISYHRVVEEFIEATQLLGYQAVYILVDSVDEVKLPLPLTWVECLEPLLSDLHLMRMPGLAFKFFLPAEKMDDFLSKPYVRSDKLEHADLQWSHEDLMALFKNRLRAYNSAGVDSLRMMSEPRLSTLIDGKMIEHSQGVPRNLIHIARHLIQTHCTHQGERGLITISEWDQAVREMDASHDMIPPVTRLPQLIVGQTLVMIGQQEIKLSKNEYKLLWGLAHNNGRFSKQELVVYVYGAGQGVSDDSISGLVKRLREKLGDSSEDPKYIHTLHGTGFELRNWQLKEN